MASGVEVDDECKTAFKDDMKMYKKHRYVIFAMSADLKKIQVEKRAEKDASFDDFVCDLKQTLEKRECRYAIYDVEYETGRGGITQKLALVHWSPDESSVKQKMLYASSKDAFKKCLGDGLSTEIQANEVSDLDFDCFVAKVSKFDKK